MQTSWGISHIWAKGLCRTNMPFTQFWEYSLSRSKGFWGVSFAKRRKNFGYLILKVLLNRWHFQIICFWLSSELFDSYYNPGSVFVSCWVQKTLLRDIKWQSWFWFSKGGGEVIFLHVACKLCLHTSISSCVLNHSLTHYSLCRVYNIVNYIGNDWTRFRTLHRNFLNIIASVDVPDIHATQVGAPSIM